MKLAYIFEVKCLTVALLFAASNASALISENAYTTASQTDAIPANVVISDEGRDPSESYNFTGIFDAHGQTDGIFATKVSVDSGYRVTGIAIEGTSPSPLQNVGSIDAEIYAEAKGTSSGSSAIGLVLRTAHQAEGAYIGGRITSVGFNNATVTGLSVAQTRVSGVLYAATAGDISENAVIRAVAESGMATSVVVAEPSSIRTIAGSLYAETSSASNSATGLRLQNGQNVSLAGNARLEAKNNTDSSMAYAICWMATGTDGIYTLSGDGIGTQTLKGSVYSEDNAINIDNGKFVFDNFASTTTLQSDNGAVTIGSGVEASFKKSVNFVTGTVNLDGNLTFFAQKDTSDYTNMHATDGASVNIGTDASFTMLLSDDFSADAGDYMDLLSPEADKFIFGKFGSENVAVAFENGNALVYGQDFTVSDEGRITFLNSIVIPEPSTFAAIFGAIALFLATSKRRKD